MQQMRLLIANILIFTVMHNINANETEEAKQSFLAGEYDKAESLYNEALTKNPDSPELMFNLGDILYKKQKFTEALSLFQKASQTDNSALKRDALYNQGNSLFKMQKYQEAISAYKKALEIDPEDHKTRHNIEFAYTKLEEQQKKEEEEQQEQQQNQDGEQGQGDKSSNKEKEQDKEQQQKNPQQQNQENSEKKEDNKEQQDDKSSSEEQQQSDKKKESGEDKSSEPSAEDMKKMQQNNQEEKDEEQQPQGTQMGEKISQEEAERILNSLEEKNRNNYEHWLRKQEETTIPSGSHKNW